MIDEAFDSIRNYLSERFSSPLLGAFAVAWSLINYRIFFILFSDEAVRRKFALVEAFVFPDEKSFQINGIVLPLLVALLYIFAYPWPARLVYQYLRWQQKLTLVVQQKMDDETPLTREDVREFNRINRERNRKNEIEIEERDQRIEALRRENQELESRLRHLESSAFVTRAATPEELAEKASPNEDAKSARPEVSDDLMNGTLHDLAEKDPSEAILLAWRDVLDAMKHAATQAGISFPEDRPYLAAGVLRRRSFLSTEDMKTLADLNQTVELMDSDNEFQPTTDDALEFINLAQGIWFELMQNMRAWNGTSQ